MDLQTCVQLGHVNSEMLKRCVEKSGRKFQLDFLPVEFLKFYQIGLSTMTYTVC